MNDIKMGEISELKQEINKLNIIVSVLNQKFEDHFLSDEERGEIDKTMNEKKEGKLIGMSKVF